MNKYAVFSLALFVIGFTPFQVKAADIFTPTADMQTCTSDADCTTISNSCENSCGTVPVNTEHEAKLVDMRIQACGTAVQNLPKCNMHPPLMPRCVNNRCTAGYAFDHNAGAKDYLNGGRIDAKPAPAQVEQLPDDVQHRP